MSVVDSSVMQAHRERSQNRKTVIAVDDGVIKNPLTKQTLDEVRGLRREVQDVHAKLDTLADQNQKLAGQNICSNPSLHPEFLNVQTEYNELVLKAQLYEKDMKARVLELEASNANHDRQLQNYVEENQALRQSLGDHDRQLQKYMEESQALRQSLEESRAKAAKLQNMAIRKGHKEAVPMDDEISNHFVSLKNSIFQFSRAHFPEGLKSKTPTAKGASSDLPDLLLRAKVANRIHKNFFAPDIHVFGIDDDAKDSLFRWLEQRATGPRTPVEEVAEWRASTVRLVKTLGLRRIEHYLDAVVDGIMVDLKPHCLYAAGSSGRVRTMKDLEDLCSQAYHLALFLRETRFEYHWEQDTKDLISLKDNPIDYEILGTFGPTPAEPHTISRVVFGGVIRGDSNTGKLKDGRVRLTRTAVIIDDPVIPAR